MKYLARFCFTRRRLVLLGWIGIVVVFWAVSLAVRDKYRVDFELPGSESQAAFDLLKERGISERTGAQGQIVFKADQGINDPAVKARMQQFFNDVQTSVDGVQIVSPYDPANSYQIGADGKIAYAEVNLSKRENGEFIKAADKIKALWRDVKVNGLQVEMGGDIFADQSQPASEFIGIMAAVVILIIAFGSLLAMGLPIVTAIFGIVSGVALIGVLTRVMAVPDFTTEVAGLIGIGVGIDYALLIVTRYRQALHDGRSPEDSAVLAIDTSGRAVLFAGTTVVISLLGMFMMNLDFMRSVALSAVFAVMMTMAASLTLLPAFLGFVGRNIDRFGLPHRAAEAEGDAARSFWYRWSRLIQNHPWPAAVISASVLIGLTIPVFSMRLGFSDAGNRLESDTTRRAYDLLSTAFGPGFNGPILVVADTRGASDTSQTLSRLQESLSKTPGVAQATPPQVAGDSGLALINVFPTTSPQDKATADLVHEIRDVSIPQALGSSNMRVLTAGVPPVIIDFSDYIAGRLPWFIGAVLALSFLLLLTVFHSLVVPVKAVIMNMLSIGAAFGAAILVFEKGFLAGLFGLGKEGPIEAWAPMFIFAIVFGLSMDYEVFLLTRVREEYDRNGQDNSRAVADGLAATGRVISAAALIMVCVFGAFILGNDRALKLIGFTLAFAILIDATVVRLILVPAVMELMGRANWWAPSWLVRYLPTIRVDAEQAEQQLVGSTE